MELQYLPEDKEREPEPDIRRMLLEALLLVGAAASRLRCAVLTALMLPWGSSSAWGVVGLGVVGLGMGGMRAHGAGGQGVGDHGAGGSLGWGGHEAGSSWGWGALGL